ncbi:MAG: hypothetical protein PHX30_04995 [Candidatus Pacebacteria bacterium]|nr:hypothetical protein [Candidatus Paceibacterota bacterium]
MEKKLLLFSLFVCFCLGTFSRGISAETGDDTEMSKDTITFNISTVDYENWYDDRCTNKIDDDGDGKVDGADNKAPVCDGGAIGLRPNLVCDKNSEKSSGYMSPFPTDLTYSPCDKDGVHDDYYSTSTSNEANVWTSDKNFTVKVTASDPSGIDSIRIEWISGASRNRDSAGYWDKDTLASYNALDKILNPHKTSFICRNTASCEICVVGGTCANPVIPTGDLGISGSQQIILFRATVTDGAFNSITTGFDETGVSPKLDKFYRFVVCSTSCKDPDQECENNAPIVTGLTSKVSLNCEGPLYTLKWTFEDADKNSRPSSYILEVRNKDNPTVIYSAVRSAKEGLTCEDTCGCDGYYTKCEMSATLFNGFLQSVDGTSKNIIYDHTTYQWRVKVYDDSTESHCLGVSDWSSEWSSNSTPSFTTAYPAPTVSIAMENDSGVNCYTGKCEFAESIIFNSTSEVDPHTSVASYKWFIDENKIGNNSVSVAKTFQEEEGSEHTVALTVMDKQGISCSGQAELSLNNGDEPEEPEEEENAGWDEIAPGQVYGD